MWVVLGLGCLVMTVYGHSNKLQAEAELQTSLMPQELNPEFVTGKEDSWKMIMPRLRRELTDQSSDGFAPRLKRYSRITSCVVLALSAIVEIVLYIMDTYMT